MAAKRKATAVSLRHRVKKVGIRGRYLLVECRDCKNRNLVVDKAEAESIYSKFACLAS